MIVDASELQRIMSFVILAAVIAAGVKCSDHGADERSVHGHEDAAMRIKAQSRISMTTGGGYGARVQIREDLHGRKQAHAMAICDCNGQGPWRPLFKPSQALDAEFPEHESFRDDVDTRYRDMAGEHADNRLRPSDDDRDNRLIHLHLIPHIYVPVVHSAGYPGPEDDRHQHAADVAAEGPSADPSGPADPSAADDDDRHANFNGHSGESPYFAVSEDAAARQHHHQHALPSAEHNTQHDYEAPPGSVSDEPHQYQVHEYDDLSKDYSNKKQVTTSSSKQARPTAHTHHHQQQQQQSQPRLVLEHKQRKAAAVKSNRAKHGRTLTSRQDLKNLLVMRPPPVGQTQTWRYVYHHRPTTARHQFYQMKPTPPLVPLFKTRTVPLILHIRQRSADD